MERIFAIYKRGIVDVYLSLTDEVTIKTGPKEMGWFDISRDISKQFRNATGMSCFQTLLEER